MSDEQEQQITAEACDAILPQLSQAMTIYRHHQLNLAFERRKAKVLLETLRYKREVRKGTLGGVMQRWGDWWRSLT